MAVPPPGIKSTFHEGRKKKKKRQRPIENTTQVSSLPSTLTFGGNGGWTEMSQWLLLAARESGNMSLFHVGTLSHVHSWGLVRRRTQKVHMRGALF
jgi:hypothetical protein